jgi:glycerol 3-phosphatase-2
MMLAERYEAFLFDLDGVLYRGADPVPHAADVVAQLRRMGKRVAFVTNNSARAPEEVASRLLRVGIDAVAGEVVTSASVTAALAADRGFERVFVVGEEGLLVALRAAGMEVVSADAAIADAVIVGLDRSADYEKLRIASILVQRGAALIGSNPDVSFPAADGYAWPGAGALLRAIELTTGAEAQVVGKPNPPILEAALARAGGGSPLVIGDRLDTDIAGAVGLGWDSFLVLTGISTRDDLRSAGFAPTYIADDLTLLVDRD